MGIPTHVGALGERRGRPARPPAAAFLVDNRGVRRAVRWPPAALLRQVRRRHCHSSGRTRQSRPGQAGGAPTSVRIRVRAARATAAATTSRNSCSNNKPQFEPQQSDKGGALIEAQAAAN
eukprot:4891387-Prymnesium_polylepis.1